jgi:hypothetical protein
MAVEGVSTDAGMRVGCQQRAVLEQPIRLPQRVTVSVTFGSNIPTSEGIHARTRTRTCAHTRPAVGPTTSIYVEAAALPQ